jgi:NAD+ kinase
VKNIGIFCKQKLPVGHKVLADLIAWLGKKDCQVILDKDTASIAGQDSSCQLADIPARVDLIIVLGGDGTLLGVARSAHPFNVPILGVNLGTLGFLAEVTQANLYEVLDNVLEGRYECESRMLLNACIWRDNKKVGNYHVLNDVVISKGALARIVNLKVQVNGQYMTSYRADGLIVSTPTGSTAYSLSAGGPIIHPSMDALVLSPICPFTLTNRPIVIPDQSVIQVELAIDNEDVRVTFDGQEGCDMFQGDLLEVKKSKTSIQLIQAPGKNYYQTLRKKLHWGSSVANVKR